MRSTAVPVPSAALLTVTDGCAAMFVSVLPAVDFCFVVQLAEPVVVVAMPARVGDDRGLAGVALRAEETVIVCPATEMRAGGGRDLAGTRAGLRCGPAGGDVDCDRAVGHAAGRGGVGQGLGLGRSGQHRSSERSSAVPLPSAALLTVTDGCDAMVVGAPPAVDFCLCRPVGRARGGGRDPAGVGDRPRSDRRSATRARRR